MEQRQTVQATMPAQYILEAAKRHCKPRISLAQMAKEKSEASKRESQEPDIAESAKKLVMQTICEPFLPTSVYYDRLGLNYRAGNAAKKEALRIKLLEEHRFHPGGRSGNIVLLEPKADAFAMFGLPPEYENPGFMHRYLQHQVKRTMTGKGFKVSLEKTIKGKSIDVVLEKDGRMLAVEIACTDKHEAVNVRADIFKAGFSKVVIIGRDKRVISAVKKKLGAEFGTNVLSKVTCCLLSDFIDGGMS